MREHTPEKRLTKCAFRRLLSSFCLRQSQKECLIFFLASSQIDALATFLYATFFLPAAEKMLRDAKHVLHCAHRAFRCLLRETAIIPTKTFRTRNSAADN